MAMHPTMKDQILLSQPIDLHWLGWRSDTVTLQRNGWNISVIERPSYDRNQNVVEMALRYEQPNASPIYGFGGFSYEPMHRMMWSDHHMGRPWTPESVRMDLGSQIVLVSTTHRYQGIRFEPIDAQPMIDYVDEIPLHHITWFRRIPPEDKDLIVTPPTFDEILQMALDHQAPKQKELREKARKQIRGERIIRVAA